MKISILGAGYVGRSLSAAAVKAGHKAMISNSRGPQTLFSETAIIGCEAGTIEEAAVFGDVVVVAIPLKHYEAIPVEPLAGKVVIDANNYYPGRDSAIPELGRRDDDQQRAIGGAHAEIQGGESLQRDCHAALRPGRPAARLL